MDEGTFILWHVRPELWIGQLEFDRPREGAVAFGEEEQAIMDGRSQPVGQQFTGPPHAGAATAEPHLCFVQHVADAREVVGCRLTGADPALVVHQLLRSQRANLRQTGTTLSSAAMTSSRVSCEPGKARSQLS